MTRVDLIKGVKAKYSDISSMSYRKKFDLKDLSYKITCLIDYLKEYEEHNLHTDETELTHIHATSVGLRTDMNAIKDEGQVKNNEQCREFFNHIKNSSTLNIEKLLITIMPF